MSTDTQTNLLWTGVILSILGGIIAGASIGYAIGKVPGTFVGLAAVLLFIGLIMIIVAGRASVPHGRH